MSVILTSVAFSGLVAVVIQMVFKHFSDLKLEKYKAEIAERQIKYSRVFDDQAKVVATLYEKLVLFSKSSKDLVTSLGTNDPHKMQLYSQKYNESKQDVCEYFFPKAIYLRESTGDMIRQYLFKVDGMFQLNQEKSHLEFMAVSYPEMKKKLEEVGVRTNVLEKNTAEILHLIYKDFQELLGLQHKSN